MLTCLMCLSDVAIKSITYELVLFALWIYLKSVLNNELFYFLHLLIGIRRVSMWRTMNAQGSPQCSPFCRLSLAADGSQTESAIKCAEWSSNEGWWGVRFPSREERLFDWVLLLQRPLMNSTIK